MPKLQGKLTLTAETRKQLVAEAASRTAPHRRVLRARVFLAYADGKRIGTIATEVGKDRTIVGRWVSRALQVGPLAALVDAQRPGRPRSIPDDAKQWIVSLACQKPKDCGHPHELWTLSLLTQHVRAHCVAAGHPTLAAFSKGAVGRVLTEHDVRPHKLTYYLERRDPEFERKMVEVLLVYKEVALMRESGTLTDELAIVSYDEKPGIQAIANTAPDLPPVPGKHSTVARDYEYVRHGTVTLMAAINLVTGVVTGQVVDRHRSCEFIAFLKLLLATYPNSKKIRVVLDNHSAHTSKETRAFLATVPDRFEFIFTPKHGSWLNLIESFFGKMANSFLRGIRVRSKAELKERINAFLAHVNADPVPYHWKYGMEELDDF